MGIIRKTKSVEVLLNEFKKSEEAISAVNLIKEFENKINKTTVYRVLDKLEDDGIIHSFLDKNGIKWYAMCKSCSSHKHTDNHPHFQCVDCGKVECLEVKIEIPKVSKHKITSSQILLHGKCASCDTL